MHAWIKCLYCNRLSEAYDIILSWEDKVPVSCECGGQLQMMAMGRSRAYEMPVHTRRHVRMFFRKLLGAELKHGTIQ